jgi:phosphoribosylformylglycinamidine (FGAM) synthase-like enzyme/phosphoribosylformylglycinamidine (FGAM) synthase-like amidotransferase family enzyme
MHRVFVEKFPPHDIEARHLLADLKESLTLPGLESLRIIQRYEIDGISADLIGDATQLILSEPQVDRTSTSLEISNNEHTFAIEYLPGQFDQRADSAAQCIQILTGGSRPTVSSAKVIVLRGNLSPSEIDAIKSYAINPVDSHEVPVAGSGERHQPAAPADVAVLNGFNTSDPAELRKQLGLAMSAADVAFCQTYFRDQENREPSITEIRVLDTYWSDHCRHTTFLTEITDVVFDDENSPVYRAWQTYLATRKKLGRDSKPVTLMDIALTGMRELRASGELDNLEESDEVNAASIVVPVTIKHSATAEPTTEEWLVMFKNETHNHPTEIEPFGGAATCLGGCIRDPLSGRSYVYQAMRVTGAGNPLTPFSETLPGKLPQRKICRTAAHGYSSYGNQIGLATGEVAEVYHPGYVAKRLEIGAVVAAAPRSQVFRGKPATGDAILLIGGRTGRDGVGGATGSSKEHTDTALENSAEVQKGDAPTERKIQRLFRNPVLTRKIKVCNDFGAGGVSVAIGEIAPSLRINLDAVPKKYDGLDGTELAISESQERMAVCIDPADIPYFLKEADRENLDCTQVAEVTNDGRLVMLWRDKKIVDLSREFLDTNGASQSATVRVSSPLTPGLSYTHEQSENLLERSPQGSLRESLGAAGESIAETLERVHQASERSGISVPKTKNERHELHRALRTIEEQQLRSRLTRLFIAPDEFQHHWTTTGCLGGAEQKVYPTGNCEYIKANNGSYHGHWLQYIERLRLHAILFPDTAYKIVGLLDDNGELSIVVSQPEAYAAKDGNGYHLGASRSKVEEHMKSLGAFRFRNDDYYLPSEDLFIEDLHEENVLIGTDGETLRFIDPVIYLRPPDLPVPSPLAEASCPPPASIDLRSSLTNRLSALSTCSRKGLGERFDASVGAGTVLWPFGGKHQLTPPDAMVAKLPLLEGDTDACSFMAWGFDPFISEKSPFHGAVHAVSESVCKVVAAGGRLQDIRLTFQEYFPKLGNDPKRWGMPFAALLGAYHAQHSLRLAAIGGKDSMSGSFNDLDVPPTLVSFALAPGLASLALSPEFKESGSTVSLVEIPLDAEGLPQFDLLKSTAEAIHQLNTAGHFLSLHSIGQAGIAAALAKMSFGNHIGADVDTPLDLLAPRSFAFLIEHNITASDAIQKALPTLVAIGKTTANPQLTLNGTSHSIDTLQAAWTGTLEPVYSSKASEEPATKSVELPAFKASKQSRSKNSAATPKVIIPAFPGTNSEYDSAKSFREVGGNPEILVFRNLSQQHISESLDALAAKIRESQILMFPGGFSAGDEPDGSAKFIATIIRSPKVAEAIMDLIHHRDGLILGICNGFQALIKTGLVPYGEIRTPSTDSPTLVHNTIGRHISQYVDTRVTSNQSPWLSLCNPGDIHTVPISHGEGRFFADDSTVQQLAANGQIATQYCDANGNPSMRNTINPNGSAFAIEGITSPCGRVFGKMAHSERAGKQVAKNIPGNKHQPIFEAGIRYFS